MNRYSGGRWQTSGDPPTLVRSAGALAGSTSLAVAAVLMQIAASTLAYAQGAKRVAKSDAAKPASATVIDTSDYRALRYRMVGPSRGGRGSAVTGIPGRPHSFFIGSAGGVWRTDNAGQTWTNVSDSGFATGSIGAIAVAPSDPNVVYVGTGQGTLRGNVSIGFGVYKSTDGGRTWRQNGLRDAG